MKVRDYMNKVIGINDNNKEALYTSDLKKDSPNLIRLLKDSKYPLTSIKRYI